MTASPFSFRSYENERAPAWGSFQCCDRGWGVTTINRSQDSGKWPTIRGEPAARMAMTEWNASELFEQICDLIMNADRPSAFLEAICDFTSADAGSLWSNQDTLMSSDVFVLRSVHNRPAAEALIGNTFFDVSDADVVAPKALKKKQPVIGEVGRPPFGKDWQDKDYTRDLRDLGIQVVALVPVFDLGGNPINVLSLYFKEVREISPDVLMGVSSLLTSTGEAIDKRLKNLRLERRKDRHEVMAHTRIIATKLSGIRKNLDKTLGDIPDREAILRRYEDTIRSLNVLRKSYESSSFKERVEERHNDTQYLPLQQSLRNILAASIVDFKSAIEVKAGDVRGGRGVSVLFHEEDFTMLFSNLYSNAVKYSIIGSVVRTQISETEEGLVVSIRNDVPSDQEDDLEAIWNYEERGASALTRDVEGEGIGLGLVSDICDVYGIAFTAEYETSVEKHHTKVFCVTLTLPRDIMA